MCTSMLWKSSDSYFGRNLDMECSYGEEIIFVPRKFDFKFKFSNQPQKSFSTCGIGIVKDGYPLFYDGMNEKGLAIAGLRFRDAKYCSCILSNSVAPYEFIPFLLSQCETCKEAKMLISDICISEINFSDEYPYAPLHWMIADKDEAVTVECTNGKITVYDNIPGILTNMPSFDYQVFNLSNYINLTSGYPDNRFSECFSPDIYSRGMGAIGLPGDMSSMSRFVRGTFVKLNTKNRFSSESEEKSQFFHMLYSVYQPKGCTVTENEDEEYTVYTSCYNLNKKALTLTTYDNWSFKCFEMKNEDNDSDSLANYPIIWK